MKRGTFAPAAPLLVILLCVAFFAHQANSQVVSISATVPPETPAETAIVFSGKSYPNADITITEDSLPFVTTTADASGNFSVSQDGLSAGSHTYGLTATDALARDSALLQIIVNIVAETTTTVNNIFFGPTIELSGTTVPLDGTLTVSGITTPNSSVTIQLISGSTTSYTASSNASGSWTRSFTDTELNEGNYSIRARTTHPDTQVSSWSTTLTFTVGAPADVCYLKNIADINCDGEVELADLSILLFYWKQTNPGNARADINGDATVTLIDFSIMMFHWTGPT